MCHKISIVSNVRYFLFIIGCSKGSSDQQRIHLLAWLVKPHNTNFMYLPAERGREKMGDDVLKGMQFLNNTNIKSKLIKLMLKVGTL